MPECEPVSRPLLTALLEHARALLGVDHALISEWDDGEGTVTILAGSGILASEDVTAIGTPLPATRCLAGPQGNRLGAQRMEPVLVRRDDPSLPAPLATSMDRIGICQELYVHVDAV